MNPRHLFLALLGVVLWSVPAVLRAGSLADLDQHNGLPDAQIGAPFSAFTGLEQIEETGRWTSYKRASDKLTFARYELTSITYNFFKGKLYSIFLEAEGKRNVRGILKALQDLYGTDHTLEKRAVPTSDLTMETREWTGRKVFLLYKNGDNFAGSQITYLDRPTWETLQIPKQERAAELRKMLQGSFTNGDF